MANLRAAITNKILMVLKKTMSLKGLIEKTNTLPRIKSVEALPDYRLSVVFDDGKAVVYDVGEDMEQIEEFRLLKQVTPFGRDLALARPRK